MNKPHQYEFGGKVWTFNKLAKISRCSRKTLRDWLRAGVPVEEAVNRIPRKARKVKIGNTYYTIKQVCKIAKICRSTFDRRIRDGWEMDELTALSAHAEKVTAWGRTQSLSAWSRELNIPRTTLRYRLNKKKMSPEEAFSRRYHRNKLITAWGRTQTAIEWGKEKNVPPSRIYKRLAAGLSPEVAVSAPIK